MYVFLRLLNLVTELYDMVAGRPYGDVECFKLQHRALGNLRMGRCLVVGIVIAWFKQRGASASYLSNSV